MHEVLNRNVFFVKEHVGILKAANEYDICDPETQELLIHCREELGVFTKLLRFTNYKRMTPFNVILTAADGQPLLRVCRGMAIFLSKVDVIDHARQRVGGFRQKFGFKPKFEVLDARDQVVCSLNGNWRGWDFEFMRGEEPVARISRKWAGLSKELFTTADNYVLQIEESVPPDAPIRLLILGAAMCIDLVLHE